MRKALLATYIFLIGLFISFSSFSQKWVEINPPVNLFNNTIFCTATDSGGVVYAGGNFTNSEGSHFVAVWNGNTWSELGEGVAALHANGYILSLTTRNGSLYAAGIFLNAAGYQYVARWNGRAWEEVGTGANALNANNIIYSLTTDKTGNLYAAGRFTNASGKCYVAKWDGTTWSETGTGTSALSANADIFTLATDSSGNVYAGGYFTNAAGKKYVAKWNGAGWSETGSGSASINANDDIKCLATDGKGNVYAGGGFRDDSNHHYIARWDGTTWSSIGLLYNYITPATIAIQKTGELYTAGYSPYSYGTVAKWDGLSWQEVNTPQGALVANGNILTLTSDAFGRIIAGGAFTNKSGHRFVARWDGKTWNEPGKEGDPLNSQISFYRDRILTDTSGHICLSKSLQYWNGKGWIDIRPDNADTHLFAGDLSNGDGVAMDKQGNVYLKGSYSTLTTSYACILKWNKTDWSILEESPNALHATSISDIQTDGQGNVYASGSFTDATSFLHGLAKWDGKKWNLLPNSGAGSGDIFLGNEGNIYSFNTFTSNGYTVSVYDGNGWHQVQNGNSALYVPGANLFYSFAMDNNHNLYVGGDLEEKGGKHYIAKWNGIAWDEFGVTDEKLGYLLAIDSLNNVYTTGRPGSGTQEVKKWNGASWVSVGESVSGSGIVPNGNVLAIDAKGNLYSDASDQTRSDAGNFIAKYATATQPAPHIISFDPTAGSLGTAVTIRCIRLGSIIAVSFGDIPASSFSIQNDSTLTAIVGSGATGSVKIISSSGSDSLGTFTYSCDSVKQPMPVITLTTDSLLVSSPANYYQWYLNNKKLPNEIYGAKEPDEPGLYRVETSFNNLCWTSSLDYPVLVNHRALTDTLRMSTYPNPSSGSFTVDVTLPQTSTVLAYVEVYDISGHAVTQTQKLIFFGSEIKIPVTLTSKGTFIVKVFVNGDSRQQTILIM